MLSGINKFFINGEIFEVGEDAYKTLIKLADNQELLPTFEMDKETEITLYQWYISGYIINKDEPVEGFCPRGTL
jgi:50S ribosomal protein L16 3-hydroxylase